MPPFPPPTRRKKTTAADHNHTKSDMPNPPPPLLPPPPTTATTTTKPKITSPTPPTPLPKDEPPSDALIQSHGIELAPRRRAFQELEPNPGLEVTATDHSTLEVSPLHYFNLAQRRQRQQQQRQHGGEGDKQPQPQSRASSRPPSVYRPSVVLTPESAKAWDSKLAQFYGIDLAAAAAAAAAAATSTTTTTTATSTTPATATAGTADGAEAAPRYSNSSDFQSPFEHHQGPPGPPFLECGGGGLERAGGVRGGKRPRRVCGMRRHVFWVLLVVGGFLLVVVAVSAGVKVGLACRPGHRRGECPFDDDSDGVE